jgi:hypothetical protein
MAQTGSWPSIASHGLLSTRSLLDLFQITGEQRTALLTRRRPATVFVDHPVYGRAAIRDQKPLSEKRLAGCLRDGITPGEWIEMLNSKVFFWVNPERLAVLRGARAYRQQRQLVLRVDTRQLVEAHVDDIFLADRNTGATSPMAHPRGRDTFVGLRADQRKRIVELTVTGGVPNIGRFVTSACEIGGGEPDDILYHR